ncbi:hypothetical protein Taro_003298 [Colocasia esculenta]|uniref:Xyloglucan endotransglucosylase/hydrolase n=1 Tax=Colocasia esculenta TaxID=4460 RepID=A0A843TNA4_COLES|nr:hypothetical protein [Colocasia esculenta]
MANLRVLFLALVALIALEQCLVQANMYKTTVFNWGRQNGAVYNEGNDLSLTLNNISGCGIQTKKQFLFGSMEMQIKLVPGNSAGTVTAYYVRKKPGHDQEPLLYSLLLMLRPSSLLFCVCMQMSSSGDRHDEIDFEFLGNLSGQPYVIHTNVFTQGVGNREQQFYPWFDPTADYHNYTIHWNPTHIVWYVDGLPIRVFRNYESIGIPYPNKQAMRAYSSIWNADNWATRGGLVKIDWNSAPFVARYRQFRPRACRWMGLRSITECAASTAANWWTLPAYGSLSYAEVGQMNWVRNNYLIYDYCKDTYRFGAQMPPECSQQQF